MRQTPNHFYDQLTDREREFVERVFDGKFLHETADRLRVPLAGDDRIAYAIDAFARAIIQSRRVP